MKGTDIEVLESNMAMKNMEVDLGSVERSLMPTGSVSETAILMAQNEMVDKPY